MTRSSGRSRHVFASVLAGILLCGMGAAPPDSLKTTGGGDDGTVTDIDGNTYRVVAIGAQVWMAENLRVVHYRDGEPIPRVDADEIWSDLTTGAYCLPATPAAGVRARLGLLYNFHAVERSPGPCPAGWRVPGADEWRQLVAYLGGDDVAGGSMKDVRSRLWRTRVPGTTNRSGFSALPAGGRGRRGPPRDVRDYATWWSATAEDTVYAWHWGLYPDRAAIRSNPGHKASGFSVRCVRDSG